MLPPISLVRLSPSLPPFLPHHACSALLLPCASSQAMALVGFLFINLEMMALEIEQPFGDDPDDLPLEEYCLGIERVCLDFLKRSPISKA